jgi:hypothetical protein
MPVPRSAPVSAQSHKLFGLAVSLAMSAINKGYALTDNDLAEIIMEEQRRNPPSSHAYTMQQLVGEMVPAAMTAARNNVPVPAFVCFSRHALAGVFGFDATDGVLRAAIRDQVGSIVKRLHREGTIENTGAGRASKWRLKSLD